MFIACNVTCSRSLLFYTSHFIISLYQHSLLWVIGRMVLACSYTWSLLKCSTQMLNKINRKTGSMYLLVIQIWLCLFVEQSLFEWYYHASLQKCQVILLWELFWWLGTWMWSAVFPLVNLEQSYGQKMRNWKKKLYYYCRNCLSAISVSAVLRPSWCTVSAPNTARLPCKHLHLCAVDMCNQLLVVTPSLILTAWISLFVHRHGY